MANGMLPELKRLVSRRLCLLADEGNVLAGTYSSGANEYVVLITYLKSESRLTLMVSDKILPFLSEREKLLVTLGKLNNDALCGVHQLMAFPGGVIYAYKQTLWLQGELTGELFDGLLADGVHEFDVGVQRFCQCIESGLRGHGQQSGSKSDTE